MEQLKTSITGALISLMLIFSSFPLSAQKVKPETYGITSLTPPYIDDAPIGDYWTRLRFWQGIPGIERAPGGRLWLTWYSGGIGEGKGHNYQLLVTSDDDGHTWSEPVAVYDPSRQLLGGETADGHLWLDKTTGRLWWFVYRYMKAPGEDHRTNWGFYTDEPDKRTPEWKGPVFGGYGLSLNRETVLSDGTVLHTVDLHVPKEEKEEDVKKKDAHVYRFLKDTLAIEKVGKAQIRDTPFTEHMVVERKDKSLMLIARTVGNTVACYSYDQGKTWTPQEPFPLEAGTSTRSYIGKLASGNLLLIVNDNPNTTQRKKMTAMLSEDDGKTWPYKLVLDERTMVSYPDATESNNGFIYATYDLGRYAHGLQEILMAKFTEADIKAGRLINPGSRLKQVVSNLKEKGGGVRHDEESRDIQKESKAFVEALENGTE
ncbi:MAG: glycoside hydrolase [Tannerella sp.]|jgi:hypothetical protein|nr:glycoside hydrolase [Tannerella sp.]